MTNSGPSKTALAVAGGVVYAAGDPELRDFVDSDAAGLVRHMLRATRPGLLAMIDSRIGRMLVPLIERWTIPGIIRHWVCRKQWVARAWEAAQSDGFDALVVLGSGFDALSLRAAPTNEGTIRTVDVDHPATLAVRRKALSKNTLPAHSLIAHDLAQPGIVHAIAPGLVANASSFVIIEGVLMYLESTRVDELFGELAKLPSRRLRVAFSFMETPGGCQPAFRRRSRLVDLWLRMRGEPFRSGLDPAKLDTWVKGHGFRIVTFAETPDLAGTNSEPLHGECVALIERIEPTPNEAAPTGDRVR